MDASAAVAALQSGDMTALAAALDWDAVEVFTVEGMPLVIARKGTRTFKTTAGVMVVHDHVNESDATACWLADVGDARDLQAGHHLSPLERMLQAFGGADVVADGDPLDPNTLVVPDYPAGFGWS